jgi:hypothetical protein
MDGLNDQVRGWLDTFSKVTAMQDNPEALSMEMDTIVTAFRREGAAPDIVDETFRMIKMTSQSRAWPTAAQVIGGAGGGDAAIFDEDGAVAFVTGGGFARNEGIGGEGQHLPQKKIGHVKPLPAPGMARHALLAKL